MPTSFPLGQNKIGGPSYVPAGYKFRQRIDGAVAGGLGRDPSQVAFIYTMGWTREDWIFALTAYAAPAGAPALLGTEGREGESIDLGVEGVAAVYHDGLWSPGSGEYEWSLGGMSLHWDRSIAHSISAHTGEATYAVRGARGRGVEYSELVKIARSFFASVVNQ